MRIKSDLHYTMNEYNIYCEAGSLGDMLAATAVFKNGRKGSVTLTDSPKIRNFSSIFNELCEVKFVPSVPFPMPLAGEGPSSKRVLNALGINDYGTPYVIPKNEDIDWAINWIRERDIKLPIILNSVTSSANTIESSPLAHYRTPPKEAILHIIDKLVEFGLTPIMCGLSGTQEGYEKVTYCKDLSIDKLSALYQVVKRYVGPDTGDYHLMVAVGGNCYTLIPDNAWNYDYRFHLYTSECFPPGRCRVRYVNFRDYKRIWEQ